MKTTATRLGILLVIGLVAISALAVADGSVAPLGIVPTPTPTPLTVNIWTDQATYTIGGQVTIYFSVNQASFIYIYDIQPDGVVRLIFPNAYSQGNFVSAGTHSLPDGLYKFTVAPPVGTEHLQIFASPVDLGLNPPYFSEPFPLVGPDPSSATLDIQVQIMGIVPEPLWATAWTSFEIMNAYTPPSYTYPPSYNPPSYNPPSYSPPSSPYPYPPFYGYPGGTWYWQGGQWIFGIPNSGWYWYFGSDGQWHFRIVFRFNFGG